MSPADATNPPLGGSCDPAFETVAEAFRGNLLDFDEQGAAVCVRVAGRTVVDLYGGWMDAARTKPWREDTLVNAYSVGKGVLALLCVELLEAGEIDLDAAVSEVWPDFGVEDKEAVTLRCLLAHRAGLPAVRERLPEGSMYEWRRMCDALASQRAYWEPGSDHGYHVNTFGFLVGEVLRRRTGQNVGSLLQDRLCGPRGAEFYFGLPAREHQRVAEMCVPSAVLTEPHQWALAFPRTGDAARDQMVWHTYFNPSGISGIGSVNSAEWRSSVIPSTSGHADARAIAALYEAVLPSRGESTSASGALAEAIAPHSDGEDRILGRPSRFGLGFQLSLPSRPIGSAHGFGHFGYGGSLGFADREAGVAFGFLTSRPGDRWQTPRTQRLIEAVYASL